MKFCPNCGHKLTENTQFCSACGLLLINKRLVTQLSTLNFSLEIENGRQRDPFAFPELDDLYQQLRLKK
ncbi:zinc-ribbon domain-containing protein [Secundilactobacillus similis]|uniref:Zinc-ribbon domain-containing protein n=1 Tax=Secundilactobacillus similis DSM 23365 = JCM 2765 TaxID=1423804 RepID=A0A0R2FE75_9LACO|nr:hypothetical protein FD14_GL000035 [Secundilactobacillus similis DSM 23365 = JCM 2765]